MSATFAPGDAPAAPLRGELRYGLELARLLSDRDFRRPDRRGGDPPVLLVPGFMAGDPSLSVLAGWLRRRGSRTAGAGMLMNSDCAERALGRIESRLASLAQRAGRRVVLIGQSRGGALARVAALHNPDLVSTVTMLGSPVLRPLDVGPAVLRTVRSVALLGDLGVPGMLSSECRDGSCCAPFRADLQAPLPAEVRAVAIYSRSDGIVSWQACLDPCAEHVEVDSSHTGMSVNVAVYRVLSAILDKEGQRWTG
jgi:pimeloyl-ACP methyl ester carboxylesterase